ncbi:DUF817 domain-containing protein [Paenibacillus sp. GCM10023248]|uniref:DUF817 domain-containing protein n=1 Tax=Bacillales TaxID=1385 RepID=UPI00237975C3|nr:MULTISPECIES: DUF817 domain-containing protein [Bacillales]MDD9266385.1 DUF817 domain-containing protein [Paenibacillus sp. MAHUQ-63]MDR6878510.1 uncharacterized membrane protein YoaT (DUF817 family) [Bacillus sp. 3255]
MRGAWRKLAVFTYQEAMCCIFPVGIFMLLAITKFVDVPGISRYDLILAGCILIQIGMFASKLETKDELLVICLFHIIGIVLEVFKVHMGSWSYPEEAYSKVWGVPLYSGFMYASVASYICQAWRRLDLTLISYPSKWVCIPFGACIYLNFFTHHAVYDIRYILIALLCLLFFKSHIQFRLDRSLYRMSIPVGFLCVGFFIWIAENIATYFGAWKYPNQSHAWHVVHPAKIVSWFLLVIVSFVIVAELKRLKARTQ